VAPAPFPPPELAAECETILSRYPTRMAALLPVLHLAQRHGGGWIPPEVEAGVAAFLGLSPAHVHGVLTFYAMYNTQPAGRHEVWVCRTLTCWLRGAPALRAKALEKAGCERTGQVGKDGRFLVKDMECLGLCEHAPAVWIDGAVHGEATPEGLAELMDGCT
jgi:NADH-quinone oxidoreductase subunit E